MQVDQTPSCSAGSCIVIKLILLWEDRLNISQVKKSKCQDLDNHALLRAALQPYFHRNQLPYLSMSVGVLFPAEKGLRPRQLKKATEKIGTAFKTSTRYLWLIIDCKWNALISSVFAAPLRWILQAEGQNAYDPDILADDMERLPALQWI